MPLMAFGEAANRYAALLADPCHGPLVQSPFGAGTGGLVNRFEADFMIGTFGTSTAAVHVFSPALNQSWGETSALTTDSQTIAFSSFNAAAPGYNYFLNNARAFRCLSACVQVYWPGSELTRAGVISIAQMNSVEALSAASTVARLRAAAPYVERMPATHSELIWRPCESELAWNNPTDTAEDDQVSALVVTAAGLPAGVGIRLRVVAVYEWLPRPDLVQGMVLPSSKPSTTATLAGVVGALDKFGNWMYHGAAHTAKALSSVYAGASAVGQLARGVSRLSVGLLT